MGRFGSASSVRRGITALAAAIVLIATTVASVAADRCDDLPEDLTALQPPATEGIVTGTFTDAEESERDLADLRGRGLVVNFWATWCPPCVREMPALDRLRADLAGSAVDVIAISEDFEGSPVVEAFFERNDIRHLEVYLDVRGRLAAQLRLAGLPTTVLIAADGREVGRIVGTAEWDRPDVAAFLRRCLAPDAESGL